MRWSFGHLVGELATVEHRLSRFASKMEPGNSFYLRDYLVIATMLYVSSSGLLRDSNDLRYAFEVCKKLTTLLFLPTKLRGPKVLLENVYLQLCSRVYCP